MRVTFLLADGFGLSGGNRVIAQHAAFLRERGHDVTLVARPPRPVRLRQRLRDLWKNGSFVRENPPADNHFTRHGLDVQILGAFRPIMAHDVPDADVVIATWWETAEWMAELPASKGEKFYFIQDHEIFPYLPIERVRATYLLPSTKITVSEWLQKTLAKEYGQTGAVLVMNGIDHSQFAAPPRRKCELFGVGFVDAASPRKNTALAISAVGMAKSKLPTLQAIAFGASRPGRDSGLPGWVSFHHRPSQDQIPKLYGACDAWLFTSTSEGFGLPILEAMACGTPVLATRAGAAPEILAQGGGRLLPAEPHAFAEAILDVARMPSDEWSTLSATARMVACRYDSKIASSKFEAALTSVVATSRVRA